MQMKYIYEFRSSGLTQQLFWTIGKSWSAIQIQIYIRINNNELKKIEHRFRSSEYENELKSLKQIILKKH